MQPLAEKVRADRKKQTYFFVDKKTRDHYIISRTEYRSKAILRWGNRSQGYLVAFHRLATSSLLQRNGGMPMTVLVCNLCRRGRSRSFFLILPHKNTAALQERSIRSANLRHIENVQRISGVSDEHSGPTKHTKGTRQRFL